MNSRQVSLKLFYSVLCIGVLWQPLSGAKVGKILYKGNPWNFNGQTVKIPHNMVAMSEQVLVGIPDIVTITIDTPSIFFIIDHSGSMVSFSNDSATNTIILPKDHLGHRFKVTAALLDTLFNPIKYPGVEVGVAVFNSTLYYDPSNGYVKTLNNTGAFDKGGYIPLYKLNSEYNGKKGIDIIKKLLETKMVRSTFTCKHPDTTIHYEYADLTAAKYFFSSDGTKINIGFDACREAMQKSTYLKKNHYVVFISDGEANEGNPPDEYVQGKNVPTTFTVFMTSNSTAPLNLQKMNENIKINGYSSSNPNSKLWAYQNTTFDKLLKFLKDNVMNIFEQKKKIIPKKIIINNSDSTMVWDGTKFIFPNLQPLKGVSTDFNYTINFTISMDSITQLGDTIHIEKDTALSVASVYYIDQNMQNAPDTFRVHYWDRDLKWYHAAQPISMIGKNMDTVEIRFTFDPLDANYAYSTVNLEVSNALGPVKDVERITLQKVNDRTFNAYIVHKNALESEFKSGDGVLQHFALDSMILLFRNNEKPKLPLDTLRDAIPIIMSNEIAIRSGVYFDRSGDGLIDSIFASFSGYAIKENAATIVNHIQLNPDRHFSIQRYEGTLQGIALIVTEANMVPQTAVTDADVISIPDDVALPNGDNMILKKGTAGIADSVAPVINRASCHSVVTIVKEGEKITSVTYKQDVTATFSEGIGRIQQHIPLLFCRQGENSDFEIPLTVTSQNNETAYLRVDLSMPVLPEQSLYSIGGMRQNKDAGSYRIPGTDADTNLRIREGDSVRINGNTGKNIYDTIQNNQVNPHNIRRLIHYTSKEHLIEKPAPFEFTAKATLLEFGNWIELPSSIINNPDLKFLLDKIKQKERNRYKGVMIATIEPIPRENFSPNDTLEATISLFDALGNKVLEMQDMVFDRPHKRCIYLWNGSNKQGRKIGAGMYVALFTVKHAYKKVFQREVSAMIMVGVKE